MLKVGRIAIVIMSLVLMMGVAACQEVTEEDLFIRAQKVLNELDSYSTIVKYQVIDEDEIREYQFKQWVQLPDKFKIEILSPKNLEGKIILSDGKQIYVNHPQVRDSLKLDAKSVEQQRPLFIGDFLNAYWLSEEITKEKKQKNGEEYIVLSCKTPKSEISHEGKSIWLDARRMLPVRMIEYDAEGKTVNMILFEQFDAQWEGAEDFFLIP